MLYLFKARQQRLMPKYPKPCAPWYYKCD